MADHAGSADLCLCGAFDLWNGSVVCWVCEEVVVNWDADVLGPLTAATFPGHDEPLVCAWCRKPAHVSEFSYAGVPVTACPAVPPNYIANEELGLQR